MSRTTVAYLAGFTLLLTGLFAAGLAAPSDQAALIWGFGFLRFLSPVEIALAFTAITAAFLFAIHPSGLRPVELLARCSAGSPWLLPAGSLAVFVGAAFAFRIVVPLLGDSFYIVKHYAEVSRGQTTLDPRNEPLASGFFYALMGMIGKPGYRTLLDGFFYGELLLGTGFVLMGYVLVRNLFDEEIPRVIGMLFILAMPYVQLFFGYVETYALVLFMLMLYAMTAVLVLRGKAPFFLLAALVIVHILVHYLTFLLLPSFAYVALKVYRRDGIKDLAIGGAIMGIAFLAVLRGVGWDLMKVLPAAPYRHYLPMNPDANYNEAITSPYTLFSRYHFTDLFNYFVMMGFPPAMLMASVLAGPFTPLPARYNPYFTFFGTAFLPIAAFIVIAKFDLGAARDWDVCAPYFLLIALAALVYVFGRGHTPAASRTAVLCVMLAVIQSAVMFGVNGASGAAIARYRSLFDRRNTSSYAWYSGSLYLAFYYHQIADNQAAAGIWEDFAKEFPSDSRVYRNIINSLAQTPNITPGRITPVYERWIETRPQDEDARADYARMLLEAGNELSAAGKYEEALALYQRGYRLDSANIDFCNNSGCMLAQLGRQREAIPWLLGALRLKPDFAGAHYNLANAYLETGERGPARDHLRKAAMLGSKDAADALAHDPEFADGRPPVP